MRFYFSEPCFPLSLKRGEKASLGDGNEGLGSGSFQTASTLVIVSAGSPTSLPPSQPCLGIISSQLRVKEKVSDVSCLEFSHLSPCLQWESYIMSPEYSWRSPKPTFFTLPLATFLFPLMQVPGKL